MSAAEAGHAAVQRIFGDAPGAWRERDEIGRAYRNRMGHAHGLDQSGKAAHAAFDGIKRTHHGRADVEPLITALLGELRGCFLNPAWLKPLMGHG